MNMEVIATPGMGVFEATNMATSGNTNPEQWFIDLITGGYASDTGIRVNGYTALTHCPLWQGVNIIAGDIGQVPIRLVKDVFYDQRNHPAWKLLRVRPNELQTPPLWLETMIQWSLIWGNGISWIIREGSRITDLIPLRPDCIWPELVDFDGGQVMLYHYSSPTSGKQYTFFPYEVIHIQGLTSDGVWGYPLFEIAKNTIGQGLAVEKHGNKTFANGARPGGVLEHPSKLTPDARRNIRADWESVHGGSGNAGKIAVLWEGMKFNPISMSNLDAQWIEAKKMSRIEAASLLNLPAHKLNALEDSSVRSNLEEQNETYKAMTLTRWGNKLDYEFRKKLLTTKEWESDQFSFVFDWDAFLRSDIDTLTQVGDRCVKAEIMNRNEARALLRLKPYDGGEVFGSPAINPKPREEQTGAKKTDSDDETQESTAIPPANRVLPLANAHRELLLEVLSLVFVKEEGALRQASKSKSTFLRWANKFYKTDGSGGAKALPTFTKMASDMLAKTLAACQEAGFNASKLPDALESYANDRHAEIKRACAGKDKEELPVIVQSFMGRDHAKTALAIYKANIQHKELQEV